MSRILLGGGVTSVCVIAYTTTANCHRLTRCSLRSGLHHCCITWHTSRQCIHLNVCCWASPILSSGLSDLRAVNFLVKKPWEPWDGRRKFLITKRCCHLDDITNRERLKSFSFHLLAPMFSTQQNKLLMSWTSHRIEGGSL